MNGFFRWVAVQNLLGLNVGLGVGFFVGLWPSSFQPSFSHPSSFQPSAFHPGALSGETVGERVLWK